MTDPIVHVPDLTSVDTLSFPEAVQDLAAVLYDLPEQGLRERYIDYAQRIVDALDAAGYQIVGKSELKWT
jgi:hypothetical protein